MSNMEVGITQTSPLGSATTDPADGQVAEESKGHLNLCRSSRIETNPHALANTGLGGTLFESFVFCLRALVLASQETPVITIEDEVTFLH